MQTSLVSFPTDLNDRTERESFLIVFPNGLPAEMLVVLGEVDELAVGLGSVGRVLEHDVALPEVF